MLTWILVIGIIFAALGIIALLVRAVIRLAPVLLIIGIILIVVWYFWPLVQPAA